MKYTATIVNMIFIIKTILGKVRPKIQLKIKINHSEEVTEVFVRMYNVKTNRYLIVEWSMIIALYAFIYKYLREYF